MKLRIGTLSILMKTFSLWLREQGGAIFWASIPKQSVEPARKRGHDSHQPTHHACHFVPVVPSCLCSQCHFDIQRKCPLGRSLKMMPLNASAGSNRLFLTCSHKNVCPLSVYNKSVLICYLENITQQGKRNVYWSQQCKCFPKKKVSLLHLPANSLVPAHR